MTVLRRLALVVAVLGADLGCWGLLADDRAVGPGAPLTGLVTAVAAWALQAALLWFTVLVVLVALEPVARRELTGYAACPPGVRRLLLLACGAVAIGSITAPVHADAPPGPVHHTALHLDGLPLPDRADDRTDHRTDHRADDWAAPHRRHTTSTTTRPPRQPRTTARTPARTTTPTAAPTAAPSGSAGAAVTVRAGDSLWHIAREQLAAAHPGQEPSAAETDHAWRSWYAANRTRIGSDPDLILPGTTLHAPTDPEPHE